MVREEKAALIDGVISSACTVSGSHGVIKVRIRGKEVAFAYPQDMLPKMFAATADAYGKCIKALKKRRSDKLVFGVKGWEINTTEDGSGVVLSFRMDGSVEFSFQVEREAATRMRETLEAIEELGSFIFPSGTTKQ